MAMPKAATDPVSHENGIDQNIEGHHQNTNGSWNCLSDQQFSDGFLPKIV
jgi:hypothetical protein